MAVDDQKISVAVSGTRTKLLEEDVAANKNEEFTVSEEKELFEFLAEMQWLYSLSRQNRRP